MIDLIRLELVKIKRTSMYKIIVALSTLPVVLILIQYLVSNTVNKKFYDTVSNNNIIITMCIYTVAIILANYIITREYQDKTIICLFTTPQPRKKILTAKFILLFIMLIVLGAFTYGCMLILNVIFGGVDSHIVSRIAGAWLVGTALFFLIIPFIVFIALWRKNFISSMLIALVLLIFTTPFMFTKNFYAIPHLIPISIANNILKTNNKITINYPEAFIILAVVFAIFTFLSYKLFERKE